MNLVERAEPELYRSHQVFWFKKLDDELDNFRKALDWALATDVSAGLRIAAVPWQFWQKRNYLQELGDWLSRLLGRYPASDSLRALALVAYCAYIMRYGDYVESRKAVEEGLHLARSISDRQTEALGLLYLGATFQDEHMQQGVPFLKQSLALYRTLEDRIGQATALFWLSWIYGRNDWEDPKPLLSESLQLHRDLGNLDGIADCLSELATLAIWAGDFSSPLPWLEEARKLYHDLGNQSDEADVIVSFGTIAYGQGNYQKARAYFEESLRLYGRIGVWWSVYASVGLAYVDLRQGNIEQARPGFEKVIRQAYKENHIDVLVWAAEGIASLQVNQREFECATRLFAWVDAMREKLASRAFIEQKFYEIDMAVLHAQLDQAEFARLSEEGRAMTLEQAVARALEPT
jgi:tetratricopeptide (TPR) repeat protein